MRTSEEEDRSSEERKNKVKIAGVRKDGPNEDE